MKHGIENLPQADQERLSSLTMLEPEALSANDIAYLRARESYLRPEQKEIYKNILGGDKPTSKLEKK